MKPEEKQALIKKYLEGNLSEEEARTLSSVRENDPELDRYLTLHDEVDQSLGDQDLNDFEDYILKSRPTSEDRQSVSMRKKPWLMVAAAATFLLLVAAMSFWISGLSADTDEIYQAYFKPFPATKAYRNETASTVNERGMKAYIAGDYTQAAELLNPSASDKPETGFYSGVSLMVLRNFEEALRSFNASRQLLDENHPIYEEILWYEALCHMQLNNHEKMSGLLKRIIDREGKRSFQADAILDLTENK